MNNLQELERVRKQGDWLANFMLDYAQDLINHSLYIKDGKIMIGKEVSQLIHLYIIKLMKWVVEEGL